MEETLNVYSKRQLCGYLVWPMRSSVVVTWDPVRNVRSQTPPHNF